MVYHNMTHFPDFCIGYSFLASINVRYLFCCSSAFITSLEGEMWKSSTETLHVSAENRLVGKLVKINILMPFSLVVHMIAVYLLPQIVWCKVKQNWSYFDVPSQVGDLKIAKFSYHLNIFICCNVYIFIVTYGSIVWIRAAVPLYCGKITQLWQWAFTLYKCKNRFEIFGMSRDCNNNKY